MHIPKFLLEMSKQMHKQSNRSTSDPFWQVRCKRYMVTEEGYNEHHWELHAEDSDGCPIFSTAPHYDNVAASEGFEENNKKWCSDWIAENIDDECVGEDSEFTDFFDFDTHKNTGEEWPEGYRVIHMQEYEDIVSTHLTEVDAKWFIGRKQHDYPKLYTYVASAFWSPQIKELRAWILSLNKGE
jgi:hypothetical protein